MNDKYCFPVTDIVDGFVGGNGGLTRRELFAAMALQGTLADPEWDVTRYERAKACVDYADALIEVLDDRNGSSC